MIEKKRIFFYNIMIQYGYYGIYLINAKIHNFPEFDNRNLKTIIKEICFIPILFGIKFPINFFRNNISIYATVLTLITKFLYQYFSTRKELQYSLVNINNWTKQMRNLIIVSGLSLVASITYNSILFYKNNEIREYLIIVSSIISLHTFLYTFTYLYNKSITIK